MAEFKHVAFNMSEIKWADRKLVDGVPVAIERSTPSEVIRFTWISEDEDPQKSNPYPDRKDVSFRIETPSEAELKFYRESKKRAAVREARRAAREALETMKASPTWTVAQTRQAVLRILDLLEV